ncbi:MAG TPA: TVP38/TMEM64 family protein [Planctomycetaceae bacterium]|nr:TVP38/TMEM64 family protein [Planctomycetaceae bacterium]
MMALNRISSLRIGLAILLLAGLVVSTLVLSLPEFRTAFNERLISFLEAVRKLDRWGPLIIGATYIPACLCFLPGSPLTLFGGFAFGGTFRGLALVTACVSVGSTLGASVAFLVGRTLARQWVAGKVAASPKFRAIDAAVGRQGFKIVLLTRLSPVFPFNLLNYAFGVTRVSFRDYVLASWIGMLPGTIMYVYLGSTAGALADIVAGKVARTPAQQVLYYVGLAATVAVTVLITRIAKRALASSLPAEVRPHDSADSHRS